MSDDASKVKNGVGLKYSTIQMLPKVEIFPEMWQSIAPCSGETRRTVSITENGEPTSLDHKYIARIAEPKYSLLL